MNDGNQDGESVMKVHLSSENERRVVIPNVESLSDCLSQLMKWTNFYVYYFVRCRLLAPSCVGLCVN